MDISRNTTNPFYTSIEAYVNQSTGAVSLQLQQALLCDTATQALKWLH